MKQRMVKADRAEDKEAEDPKAAGANKEWVVKWAADRWVAR